MLAKETLELRATRDEEKRRKKKYKTKTHIIKVLVILKHQNCVGTFCIFGSNTLNQCMVKVKCKQNRRKQTNDIYTSLTIDNIDLCACMYYMLEIENYHAIS